MAVKQIVLAEPAGASPPVKGGSSQALFQITAVGFQEDT